MRYKKGTFCTVPINQIKGIDPLSQVIFMWLCFHANQDGVCFPGYELLSLETGISKRTIIQKIELLENAGVLTKDKKRIGGRQARNVYTINILDHFQGEVESLCQGEDTSLGQSDFPANTECKSRTHIYVEPNSINQNNISETLNIKKLTEPFIEKYGEEMINKFLNYWTQKNLNGKKELWQMQKVFDVSKRLASWQENNTKWSQQKEKSSGTVTLHDGSKAIKKFGQWVMQSNQNVVVDMHYFPELKNI